MDLDDFFLTETFTDQPDTMTEPTPEAPTAEQGALFDACTYRGPRNRRGVHNTAALDPFGNLAV